MSPTLLPSCCCYYLLVHGINFSRFFPYDQQNCTFIISSWTHDSSTINYYPKIEDVNLKNFAQNVEWAVVSFKFNRVEQQYKCCEKPWIMIYAHLVIQRKPLYYIINLVVPTSIITVVAVTGFFTPSSTSSERDEKLYLGINTVSKIVKDYLPTYLVVNHGHYVVNDKQQNAEYFHIRTFDGMVLHGYYLCHRIWYPLGHFGLVCT